MIGGGATGAGCALDAQLRGLTTILIEAGDFGSGTSSASTKLIHGGLRYLQQAIAEFDLAQYRVVRRALRERRLMMNNAPHLTQARRFIIPCFNVSSAAYYWAGLKLYDSVSRDAGLEPSRFFSRHESLTQMPCLKTTELYGSVVYTDGQFDDARYNLALIRSCAAVGADVLNYARVLEFEKASDGKARAAFIEDRESQARFVVQARAFINATGPFSDRVRRLANSDVKARLRLSKGVHILLPMRSDFGENALLIPKTDDGRVIFAIPWSGRLLVGTTETEAALDSEMIVTREEAEYLLRHLNQYIAPPFQVADIVSAFAGLRPLVASTDSRETKRLIRDYEIEVEQRSGLVSVLGGKWTVYRAMAEDAMDTVEKLLTGRATGSQTRDYALIDTHPPRSVVRCVREEMALNIEDILSRRWGLQYYDWRLAIAAAPVVGQILGRELEWSRDRMRNQIAEYIDRINGFLKALGLEPMEDSCHDNFF